MNGGNIAERKLPMSGKSILAIMLAVGSLGVFTAAAGAFHDGPGARERLTMTPFAAVLTPEQKQTLLSMVKADRNKLQALHKHLHEAREALIDKLLSADPSVDISKQVADLKAAQAAMIDERVSIAVAARKLLTPQQLKDAAAFHAKLEDLHRQEAALMQQMEGNKDQPGEE
jgi:Spy/CpxP family protein refolding chaperone